MVQLSEELIRVLDAEAARTSRSRSAVVREAVERYFADVGEVAIDREIVAGYRRIPPGIPDGWADVEELGDRGTRELGRRLDHEEREAGLPPW